MILGSGCLGGRALDGSAVRQALADTGLSRVLLVATAGAGISGLAGVPASGVRAPWSRLAVAQQALLAARATRLIVELPATLELERGCRDLHALARSQPGVALAVCTPESGPLAAPETCALLLDDLAAQRVGYWHRPSRCHLLGHGDAPWLDALARRLVGMSLDDVAEGRPGALPGLGGMDFKVAAASATPSLEVVLDVDPVPDLTLLRFAVAHLRQVGFRG
jgi:hypothetical protein